MKRIIYSSCYVIDYDNKNVLLMLVNNNLIIPNTIVSQNEDTKAAIIREVKEQTGVKCELVNTLFEQDYITPVDIREYKSDDSIIYNVEYLAIPNNLDSSLNTNAIWYNIDDLVENEGINDELKFKVNSLYKLFKNDDKKRIRRQ